MELYYKDFLFFIGETNFSIRGKLKMEEGEKAGESEMKEAAKLLRAFILSKLEFTRLHFINDDDLREKERIINKTKITEEYTFFPLLISEKRRNFFLDHGEQYKDILFPMDGSAWERIKKMGDRSRYGQLNMEVNPIFDTDELFLDKESYLRLFDEQYQSCLV